MKHCEDCIHDKVCNDWAVDSGMPFVNADTCEHYKAAADVIVPPCKVGDTVYSFCDEFGCILPYFVETFNIGFLDKDRNYLSWEANSHAEETDEFLDEIDFDLDDIGKTVFLTREEAEQALKDMQRSE